MRRRSWKIQNQISRLARILKSQQAIVSLVVLVVLLVLINVVLGLSEADYITHDVKQGETNIVQLSATSAKLELDSPSGSSLLEGFGLAAGYETLQFSKPIRIDQIRISKKADLNHEIPTEFTLEASNNGENWTSLRKVVLQNDFLNGKGGDVTSVAPEARDRYQFLRISYQTDGSQYLELSQLEFSSDHSFVKNAKPFLLMVLIAGYLLLFLKSFSVLMVTSVPCKSCCLTGVISCSHGT